MANEAVSPLAIAFAVVRIADLSMFPAVRASYVAKCVTVPHDAVAVANVITAAFDADPADAAPQSAATVAFRAYAPPVTSVPVAASVGSVVNNAT